MSNSSETIHYSFKKIFLAACFSFLCLVGVTSAIALPLTFCKSKSSGGDTPVPPVPPLPPETFVISSDSVTPVNNTMYMEGDNQPLSIPHSIDLKHLSEANRGTDTFVIEGDIDFTIFIPSDFSCSLSGNSGSRIIVSDDNLIQQIGITGIVVGSEIPILSQQSLVNSGNIYISGTTIFSYSNSNNIVSDVYFSNTIASTIEIQNNAFFSKTTANHSFGVYFSQPLQTSPNPLLITSNIFSTVSSSSGSSSSLYIGCSIVSLDLDISYNIFSSSALEGSNSFDILFLNSFSLTSSLTISHNILSSSTDGIMFMEPIACDFNIIDNSFFCEATIATNPIQFSPFADIESTSSGDISGNIFSSFSYTSTSPAYGIFLSSTIFGSITCDPYNKNTFFWNGSSSSSALYDTSGTLTPSDFFDNPNGVKASHNYASSITIVNSTTFSVNITYADTFLDGAKQSWDVGQIDFLNGLLTSFLNIHSNSASQTVIHQLIANFVSPSTNPVEINPGVQPEDHDQEIYSDNGQSVLMTLPAGSYIDLSTLVNPSGTSYFEITGEIHYTIFIPSDFHAYLSCDSDGSIYATSNNANSYGIVVGNNQPSSVEESNLYIANNIINSDASGSAYGIYFANTISGSLEIENNVFKSESIGVPFNLYFANSLSGPVDISNNNFSSFAPQSDIDAYDIYFEGNISNTTTLSNNVLSTFSFSGIAHSISFSNSAVLSPSSSLIVSSNAIFIHGTSLILGIKLPSAFGANSQIIISNNVMSLMTNANNTVYGIYSDATFTSTTTLIIYNNLISVISYYTTYCIYFAAATGAIPSGAIVNISGNVFSASSSSSYGIFLASSCNPPSSMTCDENNKNVFYYFGTPYSLYGGNSNVTQSKFFSNGDNGAGESVNFSGVYIIDPLPVDLFYANTFSGGSKDGQDVGQKLASKIVLQSFLSSSTNPANMLALNGLIIQL